MEENKPLCPDAAEDAKDGLIFDIQQDPYNYVMRVVFCRWKPFILRAMDFDEGKLTHFSRFTKQLPITQKVLSENLRQLEADGLIYRTVLPTTPPQVEMCIRDSPQAGAAQRVGHCPVVEPPDAGALGKRGGGGAGEQFARPAAGGAGGRGRRWSFSRSVRSSAGR